jgi:hypothetical protein
MALLEKHDPGFERSSKVSANLVGDYACYTEEYRDLADKKPETTTSKKGWHNQHPLKVHL